MGFNSALKGLNVKEGAYLNTLSKIHMNPTEILWSFCYDPATEPYFSQLHSARQPSCTANLNIFLLLPNL